MFAHFDTNQKYVFHNHEDVKNRSSYFALEDMCEDERDRKTERHRHIPAKHKWFGLRVEVGRVVVHIKVQPIT